MAEYTVVGYIDDSRDAQVAAVIEGRHAVTQDYYDRWWVITEADSPALAGALAVVQMAKQLEEAKEEEDG
jgi:hypothetical protein